MCPCLSKERRDTTRSSTQIYPECPKQSFPRTLLLSSEWNSVLRGGGKICFELAFFPSCRGHRTGALLVLIKMHMSKTDRPSRRTAAEIPKYSTCLARCTDTRFPHTFAQHKSHPVVIEALLAVGSRRREYQTHKLSEGKAGCLCTSRKHQKPSACSEEESFRQPAAVFSRKTSYLASNDINRFLPRENNRIVEVRPAINKTDQHFYEACQCVCPAQSKCTYTRA